MINLNKHRIDFGKGDVGIGVIGNTRVSELIGTGEPYIYGETYIYPVAHPGYWGTSTRGEDNVIADWRRIRK